MAYTVTAPLIQALKTDGGYVHVYEDGLLPEDIDPTQLDQLIAAEMVAETDDPDDGEKPSKGASKAKWVAYAVALGHDEAEVDAMKKDDIVALFED